MSLSYLRLLRQICPFWLISNKMRQIELSEVVWMVMYEVISGLRVEDGRMDP